MPESSTESWERKPSLSRTLPPSWRSRHSGAKYGRTARPIMMLLTGSKTEPKKTSISQLRNGPSTRPVSNWKSTGCDGVANFWLKQVISLHHQFTNAYNNILKNPKQSPEWLTEGVTFLIPNFEDTRNSKNYRLITCLPAMYKALTSIITERAYIFVESNNLLPKVQRRCRRRSYGCKDQLLINKAILEKVRSKSRKHSTT